MFAMGTRARRVVDPINPFNTEPNVDRLPRYMFVFGPIICFIITQTALANLWYASVLYPLIPVTEEEREVNRRAAWLATVFVILQTWAIYTTYTAKLIPLPSETSLYSGKRSVADLRLTDIVTLESVATFCQHCSRYRPVSAHHCKLCKGCSMNFDHHCPALGNCIGLHNYKLFLLVIIYSWLAVTLSFIVLFSMGHMGTVVGNLFPITSSLQELAARQVRQPSYGELLFFAWGVLLTSSTALGFLGFVGIHFRLIATGKTTLQMMVGKNDVRQKARTFELDEEISTPSIWERFQLVFGQDLWQMLLPIIRSSDRRRQIVNALHPLELRAEPSRIV